MASNFEVKDKAHEVQQYLKEKVKEKRKRSSKQSLALPEKPSTPSASMHKKIELEALRTQQRSSHGYRKKSSLTGGELTQGTPKHSSGLSAGRKRVSSATKAKFGTSNVLQNQV